MENLSMQSLVLTFAIIGIALGAAWFTWIYIKEKRSMWLGVSLLTTLAMLVFLVAFILLRHSDNRLVFIVLMLGTVIVVVFILMFPLILVTSMLASGIKLIRREGLSISHMLSLGFGIAYIIYLVVWPVLEGLPKSGFFDFLYSFLSFCFLFTILLFALYTINNLLNQLKVPFKKYQYILVLGSGLNGNEITPLLKNRVDKGIEAYKENKNSILILSGGKGDDEKIPESEAMKNYALKRGIPEQDILTEDKSINTRENLLFSWKIIENHTGQNENNLLVVTTNYHVRRALLSAKTLEIPCDGRGAKTKLYFSINALVREWIAYLVLFRKKYITALITGFVIIATWYGIKSI